MSSHAIPRSIAGARRASSSAKWVMGAAGSRTYSANDQGPRSTMATTLLEWEVVGACDLVLDRGRATRFGFSYLGMAD